MAIGFCNNLLTLETPLFFFLNQSIRPLFTSCQRKHSNSTQNNCNSSFNYQFFCLLSVCMEQSNDFWLQNNGVNLLGRTSRNRKEVLFLQPRIMKFLCIRSVKVCRNSVLFTNSCMHSALWWLMLQSCAMMREKNTDLLKHLIRIWPVLNHWWL